MLWRHPTSAWSVGLANRGAQRHPWAVARSAGVRHYSVIQRGHDRQKESLYDKLGFEKDSEAVRVRRSTEELQRGFVLRASELQDPAMNHDENQRLAEMKEAFVLLSDENFRSNYASHSYSSNDAQLHIMQDGGQVAANFNPEHQHHFAFLDHSVPAAEKPMASHSSHAEAFQNATGVREVPGGARPFSASEAHGPMHGPDLSVVLHVTCEEALLGCSKVVQLRKNIRCGSCDGEGRQRLSKPRKCPQCLGRGSSCLPSATYHIERSCKYCLGEGTVPPPRCGQCGGRGVQLLRTVEVPVVVPPRTPSLSNFRIPHQGHDGVRGGRAGDLVISLLAAEHRYFHMADNNLHAILPISLSVSLLGGMINVPTLRGRVSLRVPPCVRNGQILSMKQPLLPDEMHGEASTTASSAHGDLWLRFHVLVMLPKVSDLTGRQRMALHTFEDVPDGTARHNSAETSTEEAAIAARRDQCVAMKQRFHHWFAASK